MITVTVTGPGSERKRVTDAIRTALAGSRYIVRRYALDVEPDPVNPEMVSALDVTLLESSES